jgi:hypothetical protein
MRGALFAISALLASSAWAADIPLQFVPHGSSGRYFVECDYGAGPKRCLLDSGSPTPILPLDLSTFRFESLGGVGLGGMGEGHMDCVKVSVPHWRVGEANASDVLTARCVEDNVDPVIGISFFSGAPFSFSPSRLLIKTGELIPRSARSEALSMLDGGYYGVGVRLGPWRSNALWDTGADLTVIDEILPLMTPEFFTPLGPTWFRDGTGAPALQSLYRVRGLRIAGIEFNDVLAIVSPFPPGRFSGARMILGSNVIRQLDWRFDPLRKLWTAERP